MEIDIKKYFLNNPRFNAILIKGKYEDFNLVSIKDKQIKIIDLQILLKENKINILLIDGYNTLVNCIKELIDKENCEYIFFKNVDLILTSITKEKRKRFFLKMLQTSFKINLIFNTEIFKDEVLIKDYELFNFGNIINLV